MTSKIKIVIFCGALFFASCSAGFLSEITAQGINNPHQNAAFTKNKHAVSKDIQVIEEVRLNDRTISTASKNYKVRPGAQEAQLKGVKAIRVIHQVENLSPQTLQELQRSPIRLKIVKPTVRTPIKVASPTVKRAVVYRNADSIGIRIG